MKRILCTLVPALALGWAAVAMAQAPAEPRPAVQSAAERDLTTDEGKASVAKAGCVRETGSRLRNHARLEQERCLTGRAFDRDDIDRTGEMDLARAIRKLDPSIH
jgi:hypothetical protein